MRQSRASEWQTRSKKSDKKRERNTKIRVAKMMRYMQPKTLIQMHPNGKEYVRDLYSKMMIKYRR